VQNLIYLFGFFFVGGWGGGGGGVGGGGGWGGGGAQRGEADRRGCRTRIGFVRVPPVQCQINIATQSKGCLVEVGEKNLQSTIVLLSFIFNNYYPITY